MRRVSLKTINDILQDVKAPRTGKTGKVWRVRDMKLARAYQLGEIDTKKNLILLIHKGYKFRLSKNHKFKMWKTAKCTCGNKVLENGNVCQKCCDILSF